MVLQLVRRVLESARNLNQIQKLSFRNSKSQRPFRQLPGIQLLTYPGAILSKVLALLFQESAYLPKSIRC